VKDKICKAEGEPVEKHNGLSWLSIQYCVNFIMFMEEFASRVLNTIIKLDKNWSHTNYDNLSPSNYNKLLTNTDFWNLFSDKKYSFTNRISIIF